MSPSGRSAARIVAVLTVAFAAVGVVADRAASGALEASGAPRAAERPVRHVLLGALAGAWAIASGLALAVDARRRRTAGQIAAAASAMAAGDFEARAPIPSAGDELVEVSRALNRLAASVDGKLAHLRESRDLATGILEGMSEGVLVLDAEGRVVLANRALRAMTFIAPDAIGRTAIETIRNAALQELLEDAANETEPVVREVEIGGLKPRRALVRATRTSDRGIVAVFLDVTDLRRLETIRTDFVANVSHELRTPVTAISTAVETLLSGAMDDEVEAAELANIIDRQAKRLRQLVDDLLDLSRIEAKTYKLALAEADVGPIVEQAVRLVQNQARARNVEIASFKPAQPVRARVDRRALEQVLSNLLDNAIKYAGEGAHVNVSVTARDGRVHVAVSDDGPGIAAPHLGRIFERFYRVDAGRSRELGGTGLGLSIVKHLVELMHGSIEVESAVGKGTTFTVELPLSA